MVCYYKEWKIVYSKLWFLCMIFDVYISINFLMCINILEVEVQFIVVWSEIIIIR